MTRVRLFWPTKIQVCEEVRLGWRSRKYGQTTICTSVYLGLRNTSRAKYSETSFQTWACQSGGACYIHTDPKALWRTTGARSEQLLRCRRCLTRRSGMDCLLSGNLQKKMQCGQTSSHLAYADLKMDSELAKKYEVSYVRVPAKSFCR